MTRTERNTYPHAITKDRHSRSGLAKGSETLRKNGAGAHNWGSFQQEGDYELAGDVDARLETNGDADGYDAPFDMDAEVKEDKDTLLLGQGGEVTEGIKVETKDLNKDDVASSPSDSMSSFDSIDISKAANGMGTRRMSNVSDQERDRAKVYRERVMHKPKGSVDLANIARTSYGIAQSPPQGGLASSPTKAKSGYTSR